MTAWEKALWMHVRNDRLGFHFRRQCPIGGYTLDFYCHEAKLCIELDGAGHALYRADSDRTRDADLAALGIKTLRFGNEEIGTRLQDCLNRIREECLNRSTSSAWSPSPEPLPSGVPPFDEGKVDRSGTFSLEGYACERGPMGWSRFAALFGTLALLVQTSSRLLVHMRPGDRPLPYLMPLITMPLTKYR